MNLPWTQAELARKLGVSRTHVTLLVQGKRKLSGRLADKLADALADTKADKPNAETVTSNPLGGIKNVFGRFDSHALPPVPEQTRKFPLEGTITRGFIVQGFQRPARIQL
jgi:transcriptional regulator with XRE-family HTH domain